MSNSETRQGEAPAAERERILAAVGWEQDPRRRRILRDLLQQQFRRVYFYSYARNGRRTQAIERTRRSLLRAARTLDQIPDGCSLSLWLFLGLEEEAGRGTICPDSRRILPWAERLPQGPPASPDEIPGDVARHLEAHPGCRELWDSYLRFLNPTDSEETGQRAGWGRASQDLGRYLEAQFGDDRPAGASVRPWRQKMPSLKWGRSRIVALAFGLIALILAVFLIRAVVSRRSARDWQENVQAGRESGLRRSPASPRDSLPGIRDARLHEEASDLVFTWEPSPEIESYRILLFSPKLDTLYRGFSTSRMGLRVAGAQLSGMRRGGSYLYQIDGLTRGERLASTGPTPFTAP